MRALQDALVRFGVWAGTVADPVTMGALEDHNRLERLDLLRTLLIEGGIPHLSANNGKLIVVRGEHLERARMIVGAWGVWPHVVVRPKPTGHRVEAHAWL